MIKEYEGYSIRCGCKCPRCGRSLLLEGYSDATGQHWCEGCDSAPGMRGCIQQTRAKVKARQEVIDDAGVAYG